MAPMFTALNLWATSKGGVEDDGKRSRIKIEQ